MKLLPSYLLAILLATFVSADTINSVSKNPSMAVLGTQRDSVTVINPYVIPVAVSGAACNSATDTVSVTSDHSSQLICQSGSNAWAAIGGSFGSNYSNVTGARTFNTTYSNGLGYPIVVYVVGGSNNITTNKYIYGYVNALCVVSQATTDANAGYGWADTLGNITFIVPAGATYFVSAPQSYTVLKSWVELR